MPDTNTTNKLAPNHRGLLASTGVIARPSTLWPAIPESESLAEGKSHDESTAEEQVRNRYRSRLSSHSSHISARELGVNVPPRNNKRGIKAGAGLEEFGFRQIQHRQKRTLKSEKQVRAGGYARKFAGPMEIICCWSQRVCSGPADPS